VRFRRGSGGGSRTAGGSESTATSHPRRPGEDRSRSSRRATRIAIDLDADRLDIDLDDDELAARLAHWTPRPAAL
jgi:hypothetical protein